MSKLSKTNMRILHDTNVVLIHDKHSYDYRRGMIVLVNRILMDSGIPYKYRYLTINEVPAGQLPGINLLDGSPHPDYKMRFDNTDDTRREYILND